MKKRILGILILMESNILLLTAVVSLLCGEDDWKVFFLTAGISIFLGILLRWIGSKDGHSRLTRADSFIIVSLSWIIFSVIGSIPFLLISRMDMASAFFETMSGFTTTGATVIADIDGISCTLKFWRSITQWMGGLGIVVFSFALIPVYEMKSNSIFSAEATGIGLDKLRPKIGSTARRLLLIYIILTIACGLLYWMGPMDGFDSLCHSMTTIATGGFSTHTASIGYYHSPYIEYVCSIFMLLASINFTLYYYISIRKTDVFLRNHEMHFFLKTVLCAVVLFCLLFLFTTGNVEAFGKFPDGIEDTFRTSLFHVSTCVTSSGFSAGKFDHVAWGAPFWMPTILLMAVGGCAGSTAGGIKMVRILICFKNISNEFRLLVHPRAVVAIRMGGGLIEEARIRKTLTFLFIYTTLVALSVIILTLFGNDINTAIGSSVSMLSNTGPATGNAGPASNFAFMPPGCKWFMSLYMLIGRLEIFTFLLLFLPSFWKQKN